MANPVDKSIKIFDSQIDVVVRNLTAELNAWLASLQTLNGNLVFNDVNMNLSTAFASNFNIMLSQSGYNEFINNFNADQSVVIKDMMAARVNSTFPLKFTKVDVSTFRAMQTIDFTELFNIGTAAGKTLQTNIMSAVLSGEDFRTIHLKLMGVLEDNLQRYAKTYVLSSRQTLMQKAEYLSAAHYEGEKFWEYVGPRDNKNREQCVRGKSQRYFTEPERIEFEGEGFRWNCRHTFQLILKEDYKSGIG